MKFLSLCFVILLSSASFANEEGCLLDGRELNISSSKNIFRGFSYPLYPEVIDQYLLEYQALPPLLQELIYFSRTNSRTAPAYRDICADSMTLRDIVSSMDYLAIDEVIFTHPLSKFEQKLFRVDISVGGGNGAYLYLKEVGSHFKIVYEDFDGDLYTCLPEFMSAN